ncbi:heat shock 70 kDa protein 12A-like [Seriola aureovittata]|uniref:heat shock 70 kDa protein 12A-like n=1 Tax=Seriola aureovittata TaxID=2871759 RepID=UPI0024BEBE36|nr:heat shock 70 kDa protein 12A-like [Seriola aureovittata]
MSDSFIIAIDFGTAYSGYAFSVSPREAQTEPILKTWGKKYGFDTPKTPTCILFNEKEEFITFGYDAKMAYCKMGKTESQEKYFFENFKMSLYGTQLDRNMMIPAANGKSMNALKVFTAALRFLKEDALDTISAHTSGRQYIASDFTWVLTVPAIWDVAAKQFMREAATEAGIVTNESANRLVIALEPEAASVWSKKLPVDGFIADNQNKDTLEQAPGTQYIVVDCGGGTVDISVHEVLYGGALKQLHKACGNNMGGQTVDEKFKDFLKEIFLDDLWDEYEKSYPSELQRIMYDFTVVKQVDDDATILCPFNLAELARKRQNIDMYFKQVQGASWEDGEIKISREKMKSFFAESVGKITNNLREILKKGFEIQYILLVGGYASSDVLRRYITNQFTAQCKVLCPYRAQEAILKGAVMFGKTPEVVAIRKSAFTYGIDVWQIFDESIHKKEKKTSNNDGLWCRDIFRKLVEIGEDVGWDETREHIFHPVDANQTFVNFAFYRTERENPMYVDEWGLEAVGSVDVSMPLTERGRNRKIKLEIKFGSTEIQATVTDVDSKCTGRTNIDFMTKA